MTDTTNPIHVLHVDDEPDFANLVATVLEDEGEFTVETATSVNEGVDRLAADIDCIVSDYDMPGQTGIEFLEIVREEYPNLPFILYTGKGSEEVASGAISAGATDYLQKDSGLEHYELLTNRITNVVAQYRAEQQAVESQRQLRELTAAANDILWMLTADWSELLFVNSAYEDLFGRSMDRLEENPQDFLNGIHPEDRDRVRDIMATVSHGDSARIEYRVNAVEEYGRWVWSQAEPIYNETGSVVRVAGFTRDITERKRREQQLREERDRFMALFQSIPEGVVHAGFEDGEPRVRNVNSAFTDMFGYSREELIGASLNEYIVPERYKNEAIWMDEMTTALDCIERPVIRQTAGGEREFLFRSIPFEAERGAIEGIGVYINITGHKEQYGR